MNKGYAKISLEYHKRVLENSVKMYENTLMEMAERHVEEESISFVVEMKKQTEEEIKKVDEVLNSLEKSDEASFVVAYNELMEKINKLNPYARNRFIVDFENDEIKQYFVDSVSYTKDRLRIRFRNSEEFFAPDYFERNKWFENVRVFLLSPTEEKKAMITFYELSVEDFMTDELNYTDDSILGTEVVFIFKKVIHSNNANKIEKDPQ